MKKVLLATSALSLLAGAAAADVSVSGSARMGVVSTKLGAAARVTATSYRMRLNFSGSGETDGGISFGAFLRAQANNAAAGTLNGANVWVSNGTATLTVGNTSGAVGNTAGIYGCGSGYGAGGPFPLLHACSDVAAWTHVSYSSGGAGANVVRLDFALGSANVSISGGNGNDAEYAANFSLGNIKIGIGHDTGTGAGFAGGGTTFTVASDLGSANVGLVYHTNAAGGANSWMLRGTYPMGSGNIGFYYGSLGSIFGVPVAGGFTQYGVDYDHSLGGGATASIAYRALSAGGVSSSQVSAGIKLKF